LLLIDSHDYRRLGNTSLTVSPIGLGTVKFGRTTGLKYPKPFDLPDDKSLANLLALAKDLGINFIDTAPAYGISESRLGKLLKTTKEHWCICTKVGEYHHDGISHYDFTSKSTRRSVESSLKKLKLEVLDLVLVHSDGNDRHVIEKTDVLSSLEKLKSAGLIKHIGFSGKHVADSLLAMEIVDVYMIALNESDQSQAELIKTAAQNNKGVVIKKALESGHTRDLSKALNFAINFPGVTSAIVGTINPQHLKQNVESIVSADRSAKGP
jgi:aryl-alcohol dehydrogenase-like predicted oxidoreductase